MPIIATDYHKHLGRAVGNGHCVALVQATSAVGHTSGWRAGAGARDAHHAEGTVIATFDANGRYANQTDGTSHAAILLGAQVDGLLVMDQWQGQPAHHRLIQFRAGQGDPVNDGDQFRLVEKA